MKCTQRFYRVPFALNFGSGFVTYERVVGSAIYRFNSWHKWIDEKQDFVGQLKEEWPADWDMGPTRPYFASEHMDSWNENR